MTPAEIQAIRDLHAHGCVALGIHPEGEEGRAFRLRIVEAYAGAKGGDVEPLPRKVLDVLKDVD